MNMQKLKVVLGKFSLACIFSTLALGQMRGENPRRLDRDGNPLPAGAIARLGTLNMQGCGDPILFTPGGKYFVSTAGSSRSQVAFFDPNSGKRLFEINTSATGSHLRFSPDGTRLACPVNGSYHNPVWDVPNRKKVFTFEGSQAGFSADGSRLITVSYYGKGHCRILDSTSGQVIEDHALEAEVSWAEILPDGTKIVLHDQANGRVVLFDLASKTRTEVIACEKGFGGTASPDGKTLALANRQGIRLVDLTKGKELAYWKPRVDGLAVFASDGRQLAWSGYDEERGNTYPWVVETGGGMSRRAGVPTNNFAPPCFTPDGMALVVLEDGGIPVWRDLETGKNIRLREGHTGTVWDVLPLADGHHLLSRDANRLLIWDLRTNRLVKRYPDDLPPGETAMYRPTRSGHVLTFQAGTGTLRLRDVVTTRELLRLDTRTGKEPFGVLPSARRSPDQRVFKGQADGLKFLSEKGLVDNGGNKIDHTWQKTVFEIKTSSDDHYLALYYSDFPPGHKGEGRLGLWDLVTGKPLSHLQPPPGRFCFSPNCRLLATTTFEGAINVWEIATGQKRLSLKGHLQGEIPALAFLPDGRTLVSGGSDGQVMVWDLTGRAPDGKWQTTSIGPERFKDLWALLQGADAVLAHLAIWDLVADPTGSVPFLVEYLQPASAPGTRVMVQLFEDLDSSTFASRQRASKEIAKWGEAVLPDIRAAVKNPKSLEQAMRLKPVLADLERSDLTGERLRGARAVEVLQAIGTDEARKVLDTLAHGFEGARLTQEAKRALKR